MALMSQMTPLNTHAEQILEKMKKHLAVGGGAVTMISGLAREGGMGCQGK